MRVRDLEKIPDCMEKLGRWPEVEESTDYKTFPSLLSQNLNLSLMVDCPAQGCAPSPYIGERWLTGEETLMASLTRQTTL